MGILPVGLDLVEHPMSRHLTTSELADALGVASSTVRHYRSAGRIKPASQTPGGHARYDIAEVAGALGVELNDADAPEIIGLTGETFAPLGRHDVTSSRRSGTLAAEVIALGVREAPEPPARASSRPRWGGQLLNARRRVPARA
jgi:transcriptional regulator with XRE-family HTH domain